MIRERIRSVLTLSPTRRPFRPRHAAAVLALFVICLVPVLALFGQAQASGLPADDPYFGTWVNEKYDTSRVDCAARVVITPDGHELDYRHMADSVPSSEGWHAIEETWVEAGAHWYKTRFQPVADQCRRHHWRTGLGAVRVPRDDQLAGPRLYNHVQAEMKAIAALLLAILPAAALCSQAVDRAEAMREMGVSLDLPADIEMLPPVEQADLEYQIAYRFTGARYEVRISLFPQSWLFASPAMATSTSTSPSSRWDCSRPSRRTACISANRPICRHPLSGKSSARTGE
jgi:hypothetical protein